jgi:ABC-type phosphate transport system ATPase subunit
VTEDIVDQGSRAPDRREAVLVAYDRQTLRRVAIVAGLVAILVASFVGDLATGPSSLGAAETLRTILWPGEASRSTLVIVWDVRMPAAVMAALVGVALSLAGAGMQLASLAQAIVRAPKLLLLDEPTSALDLRHQLDVMTIVRELAREGRIVVVVLHDLTLAASWSDHLVVLDCGTVVAEGRPEEALSSSILSAVYGVAARVERCSRGRLHIMVDGPANPTELRHAN